MDDAAAKARRKAVLLRNIFQGNFTQMSPFGPWYVHLIPMNVFSIVPGFEQLKNN